MSDHNENKIWGFYLTPCTLNILVVARSDGNSFEENGNCGNVETNTVIIRSRNRLGTIYYKLYQTGFLIPTGYCPHMILVAMLPMDLVPLQESMEHHPTILLLVLECTILALFGVYAGGAVNLGWDQRIM
ncbi:9028_t:CDS:2, partial [Gigaspora rosea]